MQFQKNPSQNQLHFLIYFVVLQIPPTPRKFKPLLWEGGRSMDIFWKVMHNAGNMYKNLSTISSYIFWPQCECVLFCLNGDNNKH